MRKWATSKKKREKREREEEQLFKLNHDAFQFQQRCNSAGRGGRERIVIALIRCKSLKHAPRIDDARISLTSVTNSQPARLFTEKQAGRINRVFKREIWRVEETLESLARENRLQVLNSLLLFLSFPFFLSLSFFFLNFSHQNSRTDGECSLIINEKEEERQITFERGTTKRKSYPILLQDHKEGVVFF